LIRARWRTHLKSADSEAKVLEVVRAYLEEWRADASEVPRAAWPARIANPRDVVTWAFRLGELHAEYVAAVSGVPPSLKDFLLFATHATVRLGEVGVAASRKTP
jgi:hypothetical protein